jgi:hypothetical protein
VQDSASTTINWGMEYGNRRVVAEKVGDLVANVFNKGCVSSGLRDTLGGTKFMEMRASSLTQKEFHLVHLKKRPYRLVLNIAFKLISSFPEEPSEFTICISILFHPLRSFPVWEFHQIYQVRPHPKPC